MQEQDELVELVELCGEVEKLLRNRVEQETIVFWLISLFYVL